MSITEACESRRSSGASSESASTAVSESSTRSSESTTVRRVQRHCGRLIGECIGIQTERILALLFSHTVSRLVHLLRRLLIVGAPTWASRLSSRCSERSGASVRRWWRTKLRVPSKSTESSWAGWRVSERPDSIPRAERIRRHCHFRSVANDASRSSQHVSSDWKLEKWNESQKINKFSTHISIYAVALSLVDEVDYFPVRAAAVLFGRDKVHHDVELIDSVLNESPVSVLTDNHITVVVVVVLIAALIVALNRALVLKFRLNRGLSAFSHR